MGTGDCDLDNNWRDGGAPEKSGVGVRPRAFHNPSCSRFPKKLLKSCSKKQKKVLLLSSFICSDAKVQQKQNI